jgi:hypothetical protein
MDKFYITLTPTRPTGTLPPLGEKKILCNLITKLLGTKNNFQFFIFDFPLEKSLSCHCVTFSPEERR